MLSSLGNVSQVQKATSQLYRRLKPLLHSSTHPPNIQLCVLLQVTNSGVRRPGNEAEPTVANNLSQNHSQVTTVMRWLGSVTLLVGENTCHIHNLNKILIIQTLQLSGSLQRLSWMPSCTASKLQSCKHCNGFFPPFGCHWSHLTCALVGTS